VETLTFRQPRVVALILLVLIAAGLSSLLSIGRQEDPTITNIFATITTPFPGADPGRVEVLVTAEIEERLREIPEINVLESVSATGISIVNVELAETLPDNQIEQIWSETRDALDDAKRGFPPGVLEPEFTSDGAGTYTAIVALTAAHDGVSPTIMARYADTLADHLRNISGTKLVETFGAPEEEVLVEVDPTRAAALGLSADQISAAIQAADAKVQAGRLRGAGTDLLLSLDGEITALERLGQVVVREDASGRVTRLADVAQITRGPRVPLAEAARHNGQTAVLVGARISDGLQVDVWMAQAKSQIADFALEAPTSILTEQVFDQSAYTSARLWDVGTNMAIGVALVVAVLFLTLGWQAAMIVAVILPLVSLATLATMNIIGLPIHQMSVTGLIVALGLLVDAGIVMTDEVGQRLKAGLSRVRAAGGAVRRLTVPLLASTITTVLSFMPMILLPGPAGDFVGSIAIAVVTMLLWSFALAVTITPALSGWFLSRGDAGGVLSGGLRSGALGRAFRSTLSWSIANPLRSVMLALVLPVLGFASFPTLTAQFFPGVDRDQFTIEVEMPSGTALARTERVVRGIDAVLAEEADIAQVTWVIGKSAPAFYYNIVGGRDAEPGFAHALITTTSPEATKRLLPDLQTRLSSTWPEARVLVKGLVQGPPVNAPVELRFVGTDLAALRAIGDEARAIAASLDMVTVARSTLPGGAPKVSFEVDEAKARLIGLDLSQIARQMEAGLEGVTGGSLLEGTEQLPVRVRYGAALRGNLQSIADLPILPPNAAAISAQGQYPAVPLSALAALRLEPAQSTISRRNGERTNTVQAFLARPSWTHGASQFRTASAWSSAAMRTRATTHWATCLPVLASS